MYTVGGATKALCEFIEHLIENGHEPIVCTSTIDSFNNYLDELGVKNIADGHISAMEVLPESTIKNKLKLLKRKVHYFLDRYKAASIIVKNVDMKSIDLIHTNSIRNDVGCILYKKYHKPHIMHIREFGEEDFSCVIHMPFYYRYLNRRCDLFLAVSDSVRQNKLKRGIKEGKIRTLYDGVDFSEFVVKENNRIERDRLKLVFVGGICETKGQHIAIEALGLLPSDIRNKVTLDIVGWDDPVFLASLKERIQDLGLTEQIRFLGERKDVSKILANYNIGLNCSKSEGFGRITVEYMFSGLGVIASDCGANPELIADGVSGLLYNRENPHELADKIEQFYREPFLLEEYGRQAHVIAADKYTSEKNYDEIMKVYSELLTLV